jgi:hypothetical protein
MSLLTQASLVVTPNGYKEGTLYSVVPNNSNGDFSVTRATTATRVNAAGLVEVVPYNFFTRSEIFTDGAWFKQNSTISANVTTAPNGTLTADKLIADATLNQHRIFQTGPSIADGAHVISCYAKAAEYSFLSFGNAGGINGGAIIFNVSNGTTSGSFLGATPTIESVGDGWYRCSLAFSSVTPSFSWFIIARNANNTNNYTGDGVSGIFIWGAQLVQGTSALDYQMTETRLNIPRLDYSLGSCPNILLEPQRTNLVTWSEDFSNVIWIKTQSTISSNSTTSPSGLVNADTLTGDGVTSQHFVYQFLSVTSGVSYTMSTYAKKNTNNFMQIAGGSVLFGANAWANFDLNSGVVGSVGSAATATITNVGNGWYRCTMTAPAIATISGLSALYVLISSATSLRAETNSLSTSVFLWGAQLEAGAYQTSYIPTSSASVTRNADQISRNNIFTNGLITASGGTWFVELRMPTRARDNSNSIMSITDTTLNDITLSGGLSGNTYVLSKNVNGIFSNIYISAVNQNNPIKLAIKWNGTTADIFQNGAKVVSATAFTATALQSFRTSPSGVGAPAFINSMALFPTPLTDTQCIALTT